MALSQAQDAVSAAQQAARDLELARTAVQQNEKDQLVQAKVAETARGDLAAAQLGEHPVLVGVPAPEPVPAPQPGTPAAAGGVSRRR